MVINNENIIIISSSRSSQNHDSDRIATKRTCLTRLYYLEFRTIYDTCLSNVLTSVFISFYYSYFLLNRLRCGIIDTQTHITLIYNLINSSYACVFFLSLLLEVSISFDATFCSCGLNSQQLHRFWNLETYSHFFSRIDFKKV